MSKFCPKCGEELVDDAKFCKNCGETIKTEQETQNNEVQNVENDHKIALILGYVCAILIPLFGLIFGIYLVTRKDSSKANYHGKIIIGIAIVIWIISFLLMM
ncbi:zinc-ribbon domain-containing protein [Methanobrevibacter gottschalkii]|uniref:Zinc ribbon protein n=2 Tax=Methanobrevibacter gottschalkii TaxID=190974 RepID=A0A3N5BXM3_9EURY|nr:MULTISPECIES: zinc-ribbon domain-containing protein [Methanobrevibacter]MCQ2970786.1 zinc-ribbon domain-containing protein [archaeon]OEC97279.1 hypothetical protein A9505_05545 [Methanobrevibacter sp. A27]RPF51992.1 zinc ribbon protein [Methanobrevibacter gottschalkii DSM 11977]SEL21245.1 zinc-ribbon domain-containing protein [Methanobrevibacter gottschalkii]